MQGAFILENIKFLFKALLNRIPNRFFKYFHDFILTIVHINF